MPQTHILILAAGASSRMRGSDKLVTPVEGEPLLRRQARRALATGAPVWVSLPPDAPGRLAALDDLPVRTVVVPDADQGMSRALVRGVAAVAADAGTEDALMILPGDMPGFTTEALAALLQAQAEAPDCILRGSDDHGQPGHPAIFPRAFWPDLAAVTGDEGGRSVLRRHAGKVRLFPLPGDMATLDLDTPEDWAAYLRRTPPV